MEKRVIEKELEKEEAEEYGGIGKNRGILLRNQKGARKRKA